MIEERSAGVSGVPEAEELEWYYRSWVILLAFLLTGPLALILLWFRPRTSLLLKTVITAIVLFMTVWMTKGTVDYYQEMVKHLEEIAQAVNS